MPNNIDISVVVASIRDDVNNYAMKTVDSILVKDNPYSVEVIVVSPHKMKIKRPNVKCIRDTSVGSTAAFNLGYKNSSGKYAAMIPDDWRMSPEWWKIVDFIKEMPSERKNKLASFWHSNVPEIFCAERETLDNDLFKGMFFNPAFFHQYVDCDIGMKMKQLGEPVLACPGVRPLTSQGDYQDDKWNAIQKNKYFAVDGMTFNSLWGHMCEPHPIYEHHDLPLSELEKISKQQLLKSRW